MMAPAIASAADCDARMNTYDQKVLADPAARQQIDVSARRNLRDLRDAAVLLELYGQTAACEEVIAAIKKIADDPDAMERVRAENAMSAGGATTAADERTYDERAKMRAETAVPLSEAAGTVTAAELIGADLHGMDGQDLGAVDDLVVGRDGKASYLIVSHGGFLGIGKKQIAVPFDVAKISEDRDVVFINATDESLEKAPSFDRDDRSWLSDEKWRMTNDEYYAPDKK